jgi:hypothetical protein
VKVIFFYGDDSDFNFNKNESGFDQQEDSTYEDDEEIDNEDDEQDENEHDETHTNIQRIEQLSIQQQTSNNLNMDENKI